MTYPFRLPNFKHQQREFDLYKDEPERALFWQMRTGKTKAMIDLANYLYSEKIIDQVLVIAPNGVHNNWELIQMPRHAWLDTPYVCMSWSSSDWGKGTTKFADKLTDNLLKPNQQARKSLRWLTFNSEGISQAKPKAVLERFIGAARLGTLLIVDESQDFRTPGSKRSSLMHAIAKHCCVRRILSGSALDNSPLHAWSQFEILKPAALGFSTYKEFEDEYAVRELKRAGNKRFMAITGFRGLDDMRKRIAKYTSVVLREECDDMPELLRSNELFELGAEQRKLYDKMSKQIIDETPKDHDVPLRVVFEGGAKGLKLQQITSGFLVDEFGDLQELKEKPRLELLMELLRQQFDFGEKTIVWCRFTPEIRHIAAALKTEGIPYVEYFGGVPSKERIKNLARFQASDEPLVFLGNPAAGGRGLDLSSSRTIIWYNRDYSLITRRQADERATHIGGHSVVVIDLLALNTIDFSIMENLDGKLSVSNFVDREGLKAFLEGKL